MARLGRFVLPGVPQHVIQRGNNRSDIFFAEADRRFFLQCLAEAAATHECAVHAYVLMTNHVHLLVTPEKGEGLSRLLQALGRRYVGFVNAVRGRTGTLWEGRYRSTPIDSERYLFHCQRYIELNPVRAGMVKRPADYAWSSYRCNAEGAGDAIVTAHPLYRALGSSAAERQAGYRALFREVLRAELVDGLRAATNGGWPFGDAAFRKRIGKRAGRRAEPLPRGRPRQPPA